MNEYEEFARGVALTAHRVRTLAIVCSVLCLTIVAVEHCVVLQFAKTCNNVLPLLSGAPQFAVLALIVALAAYLRSIRNNAIELRDQIRRGEKKNYPLAPNRFDFSRRKMVLLDEVANHMSVAGPYFIWLIVIVMGRITCEAFLKLLSIEPRCNIWLFIVDTIIALWLSVGILMLAFAHFAARKKDEDISVAARKEEGDALRFCGDNDVKEL